MISCGRSRGCTCHSTNNSLELSSIKQGTSKRWCYEDYDFSIINSNRSRNIRRKKECRKGKITSSAKVNARAKIDWHVFENIKKRSLAEKFRSHIKHQHKQPDTDTNNSSFLIQFSAK